MFSQYRIRSPLPRGTRYLKKIIMLEIEEASDDDLAAWADESTAKEVEVVVAETKEEPQVGDKRPVETPGPQSQLDDFMPSPARPRLNINKTDKSIGSHRNRDSKEVRCKLLSLSHLALRRQLPRACIPMGMI
jgi:hypothetical protein